MCTTKRMSETMTKIDVKLQSWSESWERNETPTTRGERFNKTVMAKHPEKGSSNTALIHVTNLSQQLEHAVHTSPHQLQAVVQQRAQPSHNPSQHCSSHSQS
mmetsp:Transcript_5869/g.14238  ORF Transcript_5869/g.14238 Transcript_5869/m.14238 type:complete len:102 (-) Transcript_5869:231-536(-)